MSAPIDALNNALTAEQGNLAEFQALLDASSANVATLTANIANSQANITQLNQALKVLSIQSTAVGSTKLG